MGELQAKSPFEKYRRKRILDLLLSEDFESREVLEVGVKFGDNLVRLFPKKPKAIFGLVNSNRELTFVKKKLAGLDIDLSAIRGKILPYPRQAFHLVFTECFLQRVTDQKRYDMLFREICRASDNILVLIESTEPKKIVEERYIGRTQKAYVDGCKKNRFELLRYEFINIETSEKVCSFISDLFDTKKGKFKVVSPLTIILQNLTLPVTTVLDKFFPANRNITKMVFERQHDEFY